MSQRRQGRIDPSDDGVHGAYEAKAIPALCKV